LLNTDEAGSAFEDFMLRFLERHGFHSHLTRGSTGEGWSGNVYEIDVTAYPKQAIPLPAGTYLVECKFSMSGTDGHFLEQRPKQERLEVMEFIMKGLELSRATGKTTFGIFATNRHPDANSIRLLNAYGLMLLAPDRPPLRALPGLLTLQGIQESKYAGLAQCLLGWPFPQPFGEQELTNPRAVNYAYFTICQRLPITPASRLRR